MSSLTLAAAFALGVLYGREAGAEAVEVPPKLVYLPATRAGVEAAGLSLDVLGGYGLAGVEEVLRKTEDYFGQRKSAFLSAYKVQLNMPSQSRLNMPPILVLALGGGSCFLFKSPRWSWCSPLAIARIWLKWGSNGKQGHLGGAIS